MVCRPLDSKLSRKVGKLRYDKIQPVENWECVSHVRRREVGLFGRFRGVFLGKIDC